MPLAPTAPALREAGTSTGSATRHRPWRGHIPALDGLRALACLAVFGVHWQQFTGFEGSLGPIDGRRFLENGNTGVALFFILSGYLIGLPFFDGQLGQPRQPWVGRYVLARAVRIIPAYYASLIGVALLQGHFATFGEQLDLLLHLAFAHNLREGSFYSLSPPFWTIAVQVQAYVMMPVLLIVTTRLAVRWTRRAAVLGAMAAAAYALHWWLLTFPPTESLAAWTAAAPVVATHTLLAHAPHFVLGMLVGLLAVTTVGQALAERRSLGGWLDLAIAAAALCIFVILATPAGDTVELPYGRYYLPLVPLAIGWIILAAPHAPLGRRLLDSAPLRGLGVISYGVYVYHYPSMQAVARLSSGAGLDVSEHALLFGGLSLIATVAVATLSFQRLEAPLLAWARRRGAATRQAAAGR